MAFAEFDEIKTWFPEALDEVEETQQLRDAIPASIEIYQDSPPDYDIYGIHAMYWKFALNIGDKYMYMYKCTHICMHMYIVHKPGQNAEVASVPDVMIDAWIDVYIVLMH